jgi:hypothetical protein
MRQVNAVARFLRTVPEVVRVLVQNLQYRVSREQVVIQTNHLEPPEAELHIGVYKTKYNNDFRPPHQIKHLKKFFLQTALQVMKSATTTFTFSS